MEADKEQNKIDYEKEMQELTQQRIKEEELRKQELEKQKIRDEKLRMKNQLIEQLEQQRQFRARDVLQGLKVKGYRTVGNKNIETMLNQEDALDYDQIMNFY